MRWTLKPARKDNFFPEGSLQHPDLPLSPNPSSRSRSPRPPTSGQAESKKRPGGVNRSASERFSSIYSGDRRSIAIEPGFDQNAPFSPDDFPHPSPPLTGGLGRSKTVSRREGARRGETAEPSPTALWSPGFPQQLPSPREQPEALPEGAFEVYAEPMSHHAGNAPSKTSSDSGQAGALDRWSQRRQQRYNTEQGFREQRQGVTTGQGGVLSPTTSLGEQQSYFNSAPSGAYQSDTQPQLYHHQQSQANPAQPASAYQSARTGSTSHTNTAGAGLATQTQYSPPDHTGTTFVSDDTTRPGLTSSRSYSHQQQQQSSSVDEASMSSNNNGNLPASRTPRPGNSNRQSVHNGVSSSSREGSALGSNGGGVQQGVPAFNASVVPATSQGQPSQTGATSKGDVGRVTPQPAQTGEEMSEEDVNQLIKEHKELREKYTKVKKYYFEKEDQVKQLQNSLAHQRLSQSRTSLDDSEYTTRFNRLDGLIAQLAFSIRKSWNSVPSWLMGSVNRDAVVTGKQEMTAAGRAVISYWLVSEVFEKYFHPDLEPTLSMQLKSIQLNIRRFAPPTQTAEEDEYLTAKVVNWRLSTLEGLQESLRSDSCAANRAHLTDKLKEGLVAALSQHLHEPPPSDLEGGVHMIIELVVSMAIHLPLESRDVQIEYYMPGNHIYTDQMKLETGIPPLAFSAADDAAERMSMRSANSDIGTEGEGQGSSGMADKASAKGRSMLSALTGKPGKGSNGNGKATGSSSSLNRPESAQGGKDVPRVRMAAGIGVQVRGRTVLVKAPVFATSA